MRINYNEISKTSIFSVFAQRADVERFSRRGCFPPGTGGVDAPSRKCREASFERRGRGGQSRRMLQKCISKHLSRLTHPVCAGSEAGFFLLAQPPLLFQEGITLASMSFRALTQAHGANVYSAIMPIGCGLQVAGMVAS
jgi:hypothetical protein